MDSEHRGAVTPAVPVLFQLQDRALPVSTVVSLRGPGENPSPLANTLRDEGAIDEWESFINATFAAAQSGGEAVGSPNAVKV